MNLKIDHQGIALWNSRVRLLLSSFPVLELERLPCVVVEKQLCGVFCLVHAA